MWEISEICIPPPHTYIHLIRNPLDPSIYFEMSYTPEGVTQPQRGWFMGGGVTQLQIFLRTCEKIHAEYNFSKLKYVI